MAIVFYSISVETVHDKATIAWSDSAAGILATLTLPLSVPDNSTQASIEAAVKAAAAAHLADVITALGA